MASVTDNAPAVAAGRPSEKALRERLMPIRRRVANHDEHIKFLLNAVKELKRDREADQAELKRLRERLERSDSE